MPRDVIVNNVTVIDGTGADPRTGVDVVIRDSKFEAVQAAADRPDENGAGVLDGRGKFLIPGLWESHTHLRPLLSDDEEASQAALDAGMRDYLARGITSVVDLGGPIEPFHRYRERLASEGSAGRAQVLFAGPSFTGVNGWPLALHHNPRLVNQIGGPADVASTLSAQLDRQPDVVKIIYDGEPGASDKLPLEALSAIVVQAHQLDVHVLVHVRTAQDCMEALGAGADGLEHSFLPTPDREDREIEQVTAKLVQTGAYLTPTLPIWEQLGRAGDDSYLAELVGDGCMSDDERQSIRARQPRWGEAEFPHHAKSECLERLRAAFKMLPAMHAAGVKFATGSDIASALSRPAAALRELQLMARAGVPTKDVLLAATKHAAEKVGLGGSLGTIEPGKVADALIFDANPLDDIEVLMRPRHLLGTIKSGELKLTSR